MPTQPLLNITFFPHRVKKKFYVLPCLPLGFRLVIVSDLWAHVKHFMALLVKMAMQIHLIWFDLLSCVLDVHCNLFIELVL